MWFVLISVLFIGVIADNEDKYKIVELDQGRLKGEKYWNGDYYEFYGVPYAKVPVGRDRFKAPLPPVPWNGTFDATENKNIECPQEYYTGEDNDNVIVVGEEECLVMNLFIPTVASEQNPLPVLVYIHSGAFSIGHGNIARFKYLARHDVIVISINYRLGAIGFACLGTEDIPGNAGLKDQVAALRWINQNIKKFGGDPYKVTVAGYSVGAAMAELLALSKTTNGLIDKIILESGSALAAWAINRDPISTATNYAKKLGFNNTGNIRDITEFYLTTDIDVLSRKSLNFFLKNGTFGFAPCIENALKGAEPFLTDPPKKILKKGEGYGVAVITGFANMEGISRINHFDIWSEMMNENFADFLPTDLQFKNDKDKKSAIESIRKQYFNGEYVSHDTLQGYVDYFSDSMFKYAIMKSAELHAKTSRRPIFLYEFSYVGELSTQHNYMDLVKGASHRDQTSYILDFHSWTSKYEDMDTRDRLTAMWTDFVKLEDPTAYESPLIDFKWHEYSIGNPHYLHINQTLEMRNGLFAGSFDFWRRIYDKHYVDPLPPQISAE